MNKKRIAMLMAIYKSALTLDNMDNGFLIKNADGSIDNLFDYQYLMKSGYIEFIDGERYAVITFDGVNFIEDYIERIKEDSFAILDLSNMVNQLLMDRIYRSLDSRA